MLRRRGRVLQAGPDIKNPLDVVLPGWRRPLGIFRRPLKTSLLAAADVKANPAAIPVMVQAARLVNKLGGDFRWQHLPVPFEVYADGIDLVIFEEFGSGAAALHLKESGRAQRADARRGLPAPVPQGLRQQVRPAGLAPRLLRRRDRRLPRRLGDRQVVRAGRSRPRRAAPRRRLPRPGPRARHRACAGAPRSPTTGPRCSRRLPQNRASRWASPMPAPTCATWRSTTWACGCCATCATPSGPGTPFMSVEQAVHRLTGELADWYRIDAGHLRVGDRADLLVLDPDHLDASLDDYAEAPSSSTAGCRGWSTATTTPSPRCSSADTR